MSVLFYCITNLHFIVLAINIRHNCAINRRESTGEVRQIREKIVLGKVKMEIEEDTGRQKEKEV